MIPKNKRVLVLTGVSDIGIATDDPQNFEKIYDLTLPSKQRYVKKHGYDLMSMRSFPSDKHNKFKNPDIGFLRAMLAFDMLEYYDVVMWLDADSIITNDNYSITDLSVDDTNVFYASYDWPSKMSFSTGNFIVQNTENTEIFKKTFYHICNNFQHEQDTFNMLYRSTPLQNIMKILDHKYLGAIPGIELYPYPVWATRMVPAWPWTEDAFICHLTGLPNTARDTILKTHFTKYL
jgi:hypothetical protein